MFPSSSIPPSILSPQSFLNSPSSSTSMLSSQQFPAAGDFSGLALLQLILGTNNDLAKNLPLESLPSPNFGSSNLLLNSSPTTAIGLLQSLQLQQQLAAMEQQQRQQREQQEQMAALAMQCIQQLLAGGGTNSPILLDKEGLLEDAPSSMGFAKSGQKCSNGLQSEKQFGAILQQPPHFADPPDPPPPPSSTSSSNSTFSAPSKLAAQEQKIGRKRKMPTKMKEEKANEGKIEGNKVGGKEAENEEGEKKRQPRKRRKRRRHEAETDSPVSGMFITDHWDAAECLQHGPRMLLDESAAFVHVSEAARRTIAGLPNVIGEPCCALCRIRFDDVFRLAMHKCPRIRHTEYRCRECEKVFSCPANLASHRRWHKPEASRNLRKGSMSMKGNESDKFGANAANGGKNSEGALLSNKTLAQEAANALITLGLVK